MREYVNEMSELSMACDLRTLTTIVLAELSAYSWTSE